MMNNYCTNTKYICLVAICREKLYFLSLITLYDMAKKLPKNTDFDKEITRLIYLEFRSTVLLYTSCQRYG